MKSAPLADVPLALLAEPIRVTPPSEGNLEEFDVALEEAISEPQIVEAEEPQLDEPILVGPVAYFCPPPQIEMLASAATGEKAVAIEASSEDQAQEPAFNSPAVTANVPCEDKLKLDTKLFEPVLPLEVPELVATPQSLKPAEPQQATVANASHGTLVAQLEKRVKNSEKTAEITPAIEQKMPVRELSRRAVVEAGRIESFHADKPADHLLNAEFEVGPAETIPLKTVESTRLVETIRTEVTNLRQRGETNMTVVLRPDSGTQISLNVSIAQDGSVHAQARCERGNFDALNAQWPQLQQTLATHGIRIADLSNQNHPQQQHQSGAENFYSFDRGQNSSQREGREVLNFEEQFNVSRGKGSAAKTQHQPTPAAPTPRHWQSWA